MSLMGPLNQSTPLRRPPGLLYSCLLAGILLAVAACGPKVIEGRPPFVGISGMTLTDGALTTRYDISNQNGVEMTIERARITVNVSTSELTRYEGNSRLVIDANSTEEISTRETPSDFTETLLRSLENGELDSLSFDLEGRIQTLEDGELRIAQKGYLYRVPGRPGQFRSAVTQANELIRDDRL